MIQYNKPKFIGGIVVTKYREGTPPAEMRRIRAEAQLEKVNT